MSFDPFDDLDSAVGNSEGSAATAVADEPKASTPNPVTAFAPAPAAASATAPTTAPATTRNTRTKKQSILFFDLETVPDLSRAHLFGLDDIPQPAEYIPENDGPAPSELVRDTLENTKAAVTAALAKHNGKKICRTIVEACVALEKKAQKPRKTVIDLFAGMLADIDGESQAIAEAVSGRNKTMALCPEMNRVVALGWAVGDDPAQSLVVGSLAADGAGPITEVDVLSRFWSLVTAASQVCGYHVLGFDLPTVFVRSALLKVKPTKRFDMKPWGGDVIDLAAIRYPKSGAKSLEWLTKVNGIESEVPDVNGSHVGDLYAAGEFEKIGQYVRDDINISRKYHRMYSGFFW